MKNLIPLSCPVCGHKFGLWDAFFMKYEKRIICADCQAHLIPYQNKFFRRYNKYVVWAIPLITFSLFYLSQIWWNNNTNSFILTISLGFIFLFIHYELITKNTYFKEIM